MAPVAKSPAPRVMIMREPKGLDAMARMGAGANISSVSMIRCELDLSGAFVALLGFAIMPSACRAIRSHGTRSILARNTNPRSPATSVTTVIGEIRNPLSWGMVGDIPKLFLKSPAIYVFLRPKLRIELKC